MTGAVLIGRRTFGGDDVHRGNPEKEGKVFGGGWDGPHYVLTHHPPDPTIPGFTFVTDLASAISESKAGAGEKCVLIIGADVARQVVEADELDELFIFIAPVLLGAGTRLFDVAGGLNVPLERISFSETALYTGLHLRVVR